MMFHLSFGDRGHSGLNGPNCKCSMINDNWEMENVFRFEKRPQRHEKSNNPKLFGSGPLPVNESYALKGQQFLNHAVTSLQSFGQFLRLVATAFGHVGFASTFAANNWSKFFDNLSRGNFPGEVLGGAHDQ